MANNEEKLSKFVQAITQYAEEQRERITQEIQELTAERLQKAEQEVLTDAYKLIQRETAAIKNQSVREMSMRELAARKEVLVRRQNITDNIFKHAKEKLTEFVCSSEYEQYMEKLLHQMIPLLSDFNTIYYISRRDQKLIEHLQNICPENARVELSDDIEIGGIRGVDANNRQIIDSTMDSKLMSQHSWFAASSGLSIE